MVAQGKKRNALTLCAAKRIKHLIETKQDKLELPPSLTDNIIKSNNISKLEEGHRKIDQCRALMSKFDSWKGARSKNQLMVCEAMLRTNACYIYGDIFEQEKMAIIKRNKWTHCYSAMALQAPRREGKTEMAKLVGATIAYVMPNNRTLIAVPHANMGDLTSGLLGGMRNVLINMYGLKKDDFLTQNKKHLSFMKDGTLRAIQMESNRLVVSLNYIQFLFQRILNNLSHDSPWITWTNISRGGVNTNIRRTKVSVYHTHTLIDTVFYLNSLFKFSKTITTKFSQLSNT